MKLLVTGGAGYIGSVTVKELQRLGHTVTVFDNLVYGHKDAVDCELIEGDLLDKESLLSSIGDNQYEGVIHFAAYAYAGESMKDPYKYFHNNLQSGLNLLEMMREKKIPSIIFSSSCSIYGTPLTIPVNEAESKKPESVYGESKLMFETILSWYQKIHGIEYINLRYFNASGAALDGSIGEMHDPETHIIPLAIKAAIENKPFTVFGRDYDTPDGTAIRDYIHILDLASAHILALEKLQKDHKSDSYNLGTGKGYSNLEVLNKIKEVSGHDFPIEFGPRRPGDPPRVYADNTKAVTELGWNPVHSDIETIISSAYKWHNK
jgi:UDP-glucose 4-epimerase